MTLRRFLLVLAAALFSGTAIAQQNTVILPILATAPELHEGIWLNTTTPLKLATLRGNVVLLEMWTFGCINCIRTLPYVSGWHETYAEDGLVVIGNHYPEFGYEADLNNLRDAVGRLEVAYPILQDNDRETWSAYQNRYWPTIYLIDKWGNIRYKHIGEGAYATTEKAIQTLLAEPYTPPQHDATSTEIPALAGLTPTEPLNVRSGPSTNFEIIGRIFPNEAYYILSENNRWYQILFGDATAYVSGDYVILSSDLDEDS